MQHFIKYFPNKAFVLFLFLACFWKYCVWSFFSGCKKDKGIRKKIYLLTLLLKDCSYFKHKKTVTEFIVYIICLKLMLWIIMPYQLHFWMAWDYQNGLVELKWGVLYLLYATYKFMVYTYFCLMMTRLLHYQLRHLKSILEN